MQPHFPGITVFQQLLETLLCLETRPYHIDRTYSSLLFAVLVVWIVAAMSWWCSCHPFHLQVSNWVLNWVWHLYSFQTDARRLRSVSVQLSQTLVNTASTIHLNSSILVVSEGVHSEVWCVGCNYGNGVRQKIYITRKGMAEHSCQHGLIKLRESARNEISRTHANFARVCTNASKMLLPEPHIHILALTL